VVQSSILLKRQNYELNMSAIGILGSGFGLYGYLPALVEIGKRDIVLPVRYKEKFSSRAELQVYANYIFWAPDDKDVINAVDSIILAVTPEHQFDLARKLMRANNIKNLLLEKPLAVSPEKSSQLIDELVISRKRFRIGYNFRFTSWGANIAELVKVSSTDDSLSVSWKFLASHYRDDLLTWKRFSSSGGGALRFYGIHLIALLSEIGYSQVLFSKKIGKNSNEIVKWMAIFSGKKLPNFDVFVDSESAISQFTVSSIIDGKKDFLLDELGPFDCSEHTQMPKDQDKRLPYLQNLCATLFDETDKSYYWYESTVELWRLTEEASSFEVG